MGNDMQRSESMEQCKSLSSERLKVNQLEAIAVMLPRSPSYLGLVALTLAKSRVQEISFKCTRLHSTINQVASESRQRQLNTLIKFVLLVEWRKTCSTPTADQLEQQLWQAGYESPSRHEIIENLRTPSNQHSLVDNMGVDLKQLLSLLHQLKLQCRKKPKQDGVPAQLTQPARSSLVRDLRRFSKTIKKDNLHFKVSNHCRDETNVGMNQVMYVEVSDVGTQTSV